VAVSTQKKSYRVWRIPRHRTGRNARLICGKIADNRCKKGLCVEAWDKVNLQKKDNAICPADISDCGSR